MSGARTSQYRPHRLGRRLLGPAFAAACFAATFFGVVVLASLMGSVVVAALADREALGRPPLPSGFNIVGNARELWSFLASLVSKESSGDAENAGYKVGLVGTLWLVPLVAGFAIPVGVGAAVFLEEFLRPGRLRRTIQTNIANLAGVPSIVYGLLGLAAFRYAFGFESLALGRSLWTGGLTLALLVLPVVVIATQEALRTVPNSIRQGALALGATRWQMVRDHVIPSAFPGIMTGTILALSRAIGETAPLIVVGAAASVLNVPTRPSDPYTALPVMIYTYTKEPGKAFEAVTAGGILILLALLLTLNATAIFLRARASRRRKG